ncbi:cytochrome C [Geobacter pelophilus]|jgi:hypothetical protein|uniref:Cytochrome C n=1 Tax=Geoanaerobacter pelophilus TaxID=60036 RepID=A0AAW4KZ21_9BACT|nr:cytochrome C [Geoanaerobacter pelophilus]MBT0662790.1 cytochrome C [Geoanaerobacter pelophilus]
MKKMIALILWIVIPVSSAVSSEKMGAPTVKAPSPHGVAGKCQVCHVEPEDSLNSWFTFTSTKKKLTLDFNEVCRQCHGLDFGHGVGKKPALNRESLPLDSSGKITCAVTCHNIHIASDDPRQSQYHLRLIGAPLCLSCHKK